MWRESKVVGKVVEERGEAVEEGGPYMEEAREGLEPRIVCSVKLVHYSFSLSLCMARPTTKLAQIQDRSWEGRRWVGGRLVVGGR